MASQSALYETAQDALKKVADAYDYWSGRLTETSAQMCYALIGANWVVFQSVNGILQSAWAKLSLLMVLLALASSVVGSWWLSESLRRRVGYGEADNMRWEKEFQDARGKSVDWPFTSSIDRVGFLTRQIKAGFTLLGGILLIVGAVVR
jgi:hypothetical protein